MSAEQTHRRLGVAEVQEQLQRVSARRQVAHEALKTIQHEMSLLRNQIDTSRRV